MSLRILLMMVAVSALTGCVADLAPSPTITVPTTTTAPPTTAPPTPVDVATAEFEACLSDNGLSTEPVPLDAMGRPRLDWFLGDLDLTDSETVSALTACASHLGTGALDLSAEPEIREAVLTALQEFSECVRSRGVSEFPDPVPGFNGLGAPYPMAEIPYSDPDLDEAVSACRERIPIP
ncbi:MAG: hypothetical protein ACRDVL_02425 [Acidimicrobiia bacterium]